MKPITYPFKHFVKENFFKAECFQILKEFSSTISWTFFQDENFPQYISSGKEVEDFFLHNEGANSNFKYLFENTYINKLKKLFLLNIESCISISFHKLIKGCYNVIHNDFNDFGEKIRIICYLSNPTEYVGGELNLFGDSEIAPLTTYKLNANSAIMFAMNEVSVHSVNEVTDGERICIVITYK
jgi:hypothetical protein